MTVRLGIVGVGNCASSLVQGLAFHGDVDVRIVSALDVAAEKVGRDIREAIVAPPNNALRFAEVQPLGVTVRDGGSGDPAAIAREWAATATDVVVSLLPAGAQREAEAYAEAAVRAGCALVNCTPARIARDPTWARRFAGAELPLLGDDLKSQFGTTLIHRAILDALTGNGVRIVSTFQVNAGGNEDFRALEDPDALRAKRDTKTRGMGAVGDIPSHVATSYIPHLADRKTAFIRVDAVGYGETPIEIDVRMSLEDSPSAAPAILAAARAAKAALEEGRGGVLDESARLMKAAPVPLG